MNEVMKVIHLVYYHYTTHVYVFHKGVEEKAVSIANCFPKNFKKSQSLEMQLGEMPMKVISS